MRIQIEVTSEKEKELEALMQVIGVTTRKDLFNNALALLEWAVNSIKSNPNAIIASIDEEKDTYKELQMPIFSNVKRHATTANNDTHTGAPRT